VNSIPTTQWFDISGKGNHGTLNNFAYSSTGGSGWVGENTTEDPFTLSFDGKGSNVTCGSASILGPTASVSFEAWFYYAGGTGVILDSGYITGTQGYAIFFDDTRQLTVGFNSPTKTATAKLGEKDPGWYHVVGSYDNSTNDFYVYLNAAPEAYRLAQSGVYPNPPIELTLGKQSGQDLLFFKGRIPVVRVYQKALNGLEVSENYQSGYILIDDVTNLNGHVNVPPYSYLPSSMKVGAIDKVSAKYDIVRVEQENLTSNVTVQKYLTFPGNLSVNPTGFVSISYGVLSYDPVELPSVLRVPERYDLLSTMNIHRSEIVAHYGIIALGDSALQGNLQVYNYRSLRSNIVVAPIARMGILYSFFDGKYFKGADLQSKINVLNANPPAPVVLETKARVSYRHMAPSGSEDLQSSVSVKATGNLKSNIAVSPASKLTVHYWMNGQVAQDEMTASVTVANSGNLKSRLLVTPASTLTVRYDLDKAGQADQPANINVNSVSQLPSRITVGTYTWMRNRYTIQGIEISDLPSTLGIKEVSHLKGHLFISSEARLTAKYNISGIYSDDLKSRLSVREVNDLKSRLAITPYAAMTVRYGIHPFSFDDMPSTFTVREVKDLPSRVLIRPFTNMAVRYIVEERPNRIVELNVIQDAFVREGRPTLNYGKQTGMMVGRSAADQERYRGYASFDISSIPKVNTEIGKALLKLYFTGADVKGAVKLQVIEATDTWNETTITWSNQPYPYVQPYTGFETTQDAGGSRGYVEFDVTELTRDWYAGTKKNNGFIIKLLDENNDTVKTFATKEQLEHPPKLEITYYDMQVYTPGYDNMDGSITARQSASKDLKSHVRLVNRNQKDDFKGSMRVRDKKTMYSSITVSRPDTVGNVKVRRKWQDDLDSALAVRNTVEDEEITGSITVSKPDLPVTFTIPQRSELPGSVAVRTFVVDTPPLKGSITVSRPDTFGDMVIRVGTHGDLPSSAYVNQNYLIGRVEVLRGQNLPGKVGVRVNGDPSDLPSSLTVPYSDNLDSSVVVNKLWMHGSVELKVFKHLEANVKVRAWGVPADLPGNLFIRLTDDLDSHVKVSPISQRPGHLFVRSPYLAGNVKIPYSVEEDFPSSVAVRVDGYADLASSIFANAHYVDSDGEMNLGSSIAVRGEHHEDLPSNLTVRLSDDSDLPANLFIKALGISDLKGSVAARKYRDSDKDGHVAVRGKDFAHLPGQIGVKGWGADDLDTHIGIRRDSFKNLNSKIAVRQFDASDLLSVFIGIQQHSSLPGSILVSPWAVMSARYNDTITPAVADLQSSVFVREVRFLPGNIKVTAEHQMSARYDIISVDHSEIPASVSIAEWSQFDGHVSVRRDDKADLPGRVSVWEKSLLEGSVTVRQVGDDDLDGHIAVRQWGQDDLKSHVAVRRSDHSDLDSHLAVQLGLWGDLPGDMDIKIPSDLPSSIEVLANDGYVFIM